MSVDTVQSALAGRPHARVRPRGSAVLLCGLALLGTSTLVVSPAQALGTSPVNLGSAANYAILASAGISTTGTTSITGDIAVSPIAATAITGFGLTLSSDGTYSTSSLVSGKAYAADYTPPTPSALTTAVGDEVAAYNDAASRTPNHLNYGAGAITGGTLFAGVYKWTTPVAVSGTVTLFGGPTDVFIFQIPSTLDFSGTSKIVLSGGISAKNVFWQAAGQVRLGGASITQGTILGKTSIVASSGATLSPGRALAQTAVTLIANTVSKP